MEKRFHNAVKAEKGQAVVELAITLPILLMILCGIIDFCWIFANQNIIDHCSREGARYAIVNSVDTGSAVDIESFTRSLAPEYIRDSLEIDVSYSDPSNPRLGDVTVEVSSGIRVLTPIAGVFTKDQIVDLNAFCVMKVE